MAQAVAITIFSLLFGVSVLTSSAFANNIRYCDKKADYDVKVHGVDISPNPVIRGNPATFSLSAYTEKAISGGKLVIDVAYFGWHIHTETHDLCKEASCPVSIGDFVISHSQILPGYTPPGSYTLTMKIMDGEKQQLSCISFDFSIALWSPVAAM